jgi:hypothetical protein
MPGLSARVWASVESVSTDISMRPRRPLAWAGGSDGRLVCEADAAVSGGGYRRGLWVPSSMSRQPVRHRCGAQRPGDEVALCEIAAYGGERVEGLCAFDAFGNDA